jgi:hypothetical protein
MQQIINTGSPAFGWIPSTASENVVPKNNGNDTIGKDRALHLRAAPYSAAVKKLAGEYESFSQDVNMLIEISSAWMEDNETEEPNLRRLLNTAAEAQGCLQQLAMQSGSQKIFELNDAGNVNLVAGAMEMLLVMLDIEFSEIFDKVLKSRMQSQKDRNVKIGQLNDLLNEIRKIQKSTDAYSANTLDTIFMDLPPGSEISLQSADRIRAREKAIAVRDETAKCREIVDWGETLDVMPQFHQDYQRVLDSINTIRISAEANGRLKFTGNRVSDGVLIDMCIDPPWKIFYPVWAKYRVEAIYEETLAVNFIIEENYQKNLNNNKASLGDLLYGYGVYEENEKFPTSKEGLEATMEKINAMVSTITSTQSLKMLDVDKLIKSRTEVFEQASTVNEVKAKTLASLISMIGA